MAGETPNVPVQVTLTTLKIIEFLHENGESGVSEIAGELGPSKSTIHNHLKTLYLRDYVDREDGNYRLGFRFLDFAGGIQTRDPEFSHIHEKVRKIADETGEISQFIVKDNSAAVILFIEKGDRAANTNIRVGQRIPPSTIVAGEVFADIDDLTSGQNGGTPNYIVDDETFIEGLRSIAAPLVDTEDNLHGVLTITGPSHRFKNEKYENEICDQLLNAISELRLDVSYTRY